MIDPKVLLSFIEESGFKLRPELLERFKDTDEELLDVHLMGLVAKNMIRRVDYQSKKGHGELYYVPRD